MIQVHSLFLQTFPGKLEQHINKLALEPDTRAIYATQEMLAALHLDELFRAHEALVGSTLGAGCGQRSVDFHPQELE